MYDLMIILSDCGKVMVNYSDILFYYSCSRIVFNIDRGEINII